MKSFNINDIRGFINPKTELEKQIINDPEFIVGCNYGRSRPGHPEGQVIYHIAEVLANVEKFSNDTNLTRLRLIAIIHDTFKFKVNQNEPKIGNNHHAMIARKFAEKFNLNNDVLEVIELHDEAYNAWQIGGRKNNWYKSEERATKLIDRLNGLVPLYVAFYKCDNMTGDKEQDNYNWFLDLVKQKTKYEEN